MYIKSVILNARRLVFNEKVYAASLLLIVTVVPLAMYFVSEKFFWGFFAGFFAVILFAIASALIWHGIPLLLKVLFGKD